MKSNESFKGTIKVVPIKEVKPDPNQPRLDFEEKAMAQLVDSVEAKGVMVPITVEPKSDGKYMIIDGERRYRAAIALELKEIPLNILPNKLSVEEKNIIRFQLQETHRQWSIFEKAEAMAALKQSLDVTNTELAKALSINTKTCTSYLAILSFPIRARKLALDAKLPFTYLQEMATLTRFISPKMEKKFPKFLEIIGEKYKKGYINNSKDLRTILRLIKANQIKPVEKFFSTVAYTAHNALYDSSYVAEQHMASIANRSQHLIRDIKAVNKNEAALSDICVFALVKLRELLNETELAVEL